MTAGRPAVDGRRWCPPNPAAADTDPSSVVAASGVTQRALTLFRQANCVVTPGSPNQPAPKPAPPPAAGAPPLTGGNRCFFASSASLCDLGQFLCPGSLSRASQNALALSLLVPWLDTHLKGQGNAWAGFLTAINQTQVNDLPGCCLSPQIAQPIGTAAANSGQIQPRGSNFGLVLSATQRLPLPGGALSAPPARPPSPLPSPLPSSPKHPAA